MLEVQKIVERRARPRIETKVKVRIDALGSDMVTYSGNLSKSGVFLETTEHLGDVGTKLQLEMRLPNASDEIKVQGKVARIIRPNQVVNAAPGVGIEFLKVEVRQARTFDKLIDKLLDARGIGCRKYPRVKSQIFVELKTKKDALKAISDNLSRGGMFLKLPVDGFVLGDTLNIVIMHPTAKRKFVIDGEVVHLRKGESRISSDFVEGVGVQFQELSSARQNDLSLFLKSILSSHRRGR